LVEPPIETAWRSWTAHEEIKMIGHKASVAGAMALLLTIGLAGCSSSTPASSPSGGSTTVNVTLSEWAILLDQSSAPAGNVTFAVTNDGPDEVHEFVIIKTDLAANALPTDDTGAVIEEADGLTPVDEVEDMATGATEDLTVNLEAGSYVMICNIYTTDTHQAHYAMGMRAAFTVE
jgi:uncharacterized cupredoxin-like copper-binding protein